MPDIPPCPMRSQQHPHDAHEWDDGGKRCPGYGEPKGGIKEPAPPQSAEQRARDLEYTIQHVREAVRTDQPLNDWYHCVGLASEARVAVAEWEANAYRNQVQALIREMQRMSQGGGFERPVDVIVMDGRPVEDEVDARIPELLSIVKRTLGIDMSQGPADIGGVLLTACRELEKSEAARERLRTDRDRKRHLLTEALSMDPLRDWDDIVNAARGLREARQDRELDRREARMAEAAAQSGDPS